jgi:nucleoside-diphosphate-sugar epimerase
MAKEPSSQLILITGASGFVAAHVVSTFLNAGYNVLGTVRSSSTAQHVLNTHASTTSLPGKGKLTLAIVPDITTPGAFDEAVKGVDGVIHTASPFTYKVDDFAKDLLDPAVKGTTEILSSVYRLNSEVKRVVITSSFAAMLDLPKGHRGGYTYTERDWNPVTYEEAIAGPGPVAYCASKAFAEQAAFEFVKLNKPGFSISTICPPVIYGPNLHHVESMDKLNKSSAEIWAFINGNEMDKVPHTPAPAFADVRDVALAHLRAYERAEAGGERFFVTGGTFLNQMTCDIIRKNFPHLKERTPKGNEGAGDVAISNGEVFSVDTSKARQVLGMQFRGLEETVKDSVESLLELKKKLEESA